MGTKLTRFLRWSLGLVLPLVVSGAFVGPAVAGAPDLLLRMPEGSVVPGSGAGHLDNPRGIAADPATGRVFVEDRRNVRVNEYTAWGLFVKSWGWDVAPEGTSGDTPGDELETCGPSAPDATPDLSLCQKGSPGTGAGQFALLAGGMAVDSDGNVWIGDLENFRLQKFSPAGEFLVMLGGDVNKTKVEGGAPVAERNRCPIDPGDVCQAGTSGSGPSQLPGTLSDVVAYTAALDAIIVGDKSRIQVFNLDGTYREAILFEGPLIEFSGRTVSALDVDSAGNVYIAASGLADIYKLSPAGVPLAPGKPGESSFKVVNPFTVAVDANGNMYAVETGSPPSSGKYIVGFDSAGVPISGMEPKDEFGKPETDAFPQFEASSFNDDLRGIATNLCTGSPAPNLYVVRANLVEAARSYVSAYGPGPVGCEDPPQVAPEVKSQYATAAGTYEATVKAQINPKFWADATYFVEYGTGKCSEGGCDGQQPLPPGSLLTDKVVNAVLTSAGVRLTGLAPDTVYHYRFVTQSAGGGPVYGIDPDGEEEAQSASFEEGVEATFTTFAEPPPPPDCPNDSFRGGQGAHLPDCRAYEMVSPIEKGNADIGLFREERFIEMNQAALSGGGFTFSSITSFGEPEGAPYVSQYLSWRDPGAGWQSEAISAPHTTTALDANSGLNNEFKAFSPDLCTAWLRHNSRSRLATTAVLGYPNLYRRGNCVQPAYEAITTVEPPNRPIEEYYEVLPKGFSSDGSHTIFVADDKLHPDAPTLEARELLLYEHFEGDTRFVCYLPNGNPISQACAAGTNARSGPDFSSLHNAISADGSRIFWTAYSGTTVSSLVHPGRIYVRIGGDKTVDVSGTVTTEPSFFVTAADDGSTAIFQVASGPLQGNLYEFNVDSETAALIAKGVEGPLGASEDASRIYFASGDDLDGGGPANKGAANLYLFDREEGASTFVMRLGPGDVGGPGTTVLDRFPAVDLLPAGRGAAVTPDGRYATFMSIASPTGYDNRDAVNGEPDIEVYRYDAEADELLCVSCNPSGIRPTGAVVGIDQFAARIEGWEMNFHAPRVLSSDGSRVFFESHEALVPRDTNGAWDVYQWEEPGKGTCSEDDATFHATNGGCIDLISSGESAADSKFLDADPSGDNVFIGTQSSLVGADYGLNDVYVARVGGGFPEPQPPVECEGETCPTPKPPPAEVTPPSGTAKPGNEVAPKPKRRSCPKGKRRIKRAGKVRCVPRKAPRKGAARRRGGRA